MITITKESTYFIITKEYENKGISNMISIKVLINYEENAYVISSKLNCDFDFKGLWVKKEDICTAKQKAIVEALAEAYELIECELKKERKVL